VEPAPALRVERRAVRPGRCEPGRKRSPEVFEARVLRLDLKLARTHLGEPAVLPEATKLLGRAVPHGSAFVRRFGVDLEGSVPEGTQHRHPVGVIPNARRDRPAFAGGGPHCADPGRGVVHEVDHELGHDHIERTSEVGKLFGAPESNVGANDPSAAGLDESGGRIDRRDPVRARDLGERVRESTGAAPDVEDQVALSHPRGGDVGARECAAIATDVAVVGVGGGEHGGCPRVHRPSLDRGSRACQARHRLARVRVLLVGSGGREHALAWKLAQSPSLSDLHAAPGSPGIARLGECHPIRAEDAEGLLGLAHSLGVDLVVVGPEGPLVAGVADVLRHAGIAVFGPSAAAARIEGSKSFAKEVMGAAGVPTAAQLAIARLPCVIKADGLAAGKGVYVCRSQPELDHALTAVTAIGGGVVVEELLEGAELSVFAICDGGVALPLSPAQDYKRAYDEDEGPNTGGMGSYAPVPGLGESEIDELIEMVHLPVLAELQRRDAPFVGLLYAGLMLTEDGPRVLEFNCRFGDPETQSVVPLLEGDLAEALFAAAVGELTGVALEAETSAAVTVVLAAGGYPAGGDRGSVISGVEDAEREGALVFHAGTALHGERLVTNGGRVLNVTGLGETVRAAREAAYRAADRITFEGMRRRDDIALAPAEGRTFALRP
jgi:phosphoribosylamine--glycine ligase